MRSWAGSLCASSKPPPGLPAAACYKHTSPAGAAIAGELSDAFRRSQFLPDEPLSPIAAAYVRARGGDRMCCYGDVSAVSDVVDLSLAKVLAREVSHGIIAGSRMASPCATTR